MDDSHEFAKLFKVNDMSVSYAIVETSQLTPSVVPGNDLPVTPLHSTCPCLDPNA
jgi:hypothetical protein